MLGVEYGNGKVGVTIVEVEIGVAVVMVAVVVVILLFDFIQLQITSNGNKTANIYVKKTVQCSVYIQCKSDIGCRYKTAQITI